MFCFLAEQVLQEEVGLPVMGAASRVFGLKHDSVLYFSGEAA
jgi:hypothetical protein